MKYLQYIYSITLILLISGCESTVENIRLPEFEEKLVINAFISPSDTVSYFNISLNRNLFGEIKKEVFPGKLTGFISDGSNEVPLDIFNDGLKLDHKKMTIRYGTTYKIIVTSDKGLSAEATCIVPQKRNFTILADTFSIPETFEWSVEKRRLDVKISLQDIPSEENYYKITSRIYVYHSLPDNRYIINNYHIPIENDLISDKGMDGKNIIRDTNYGINYILQHDSAFMVIYLYNVERSYYLYHNSLRNYDHGGSPFSESTPVFSNINGGIGIFTSYTIDSTLIRLK
jgi:hypothetical protein